MIPGNRGGVRRARRPARRAHHPTPGPHPGGSPGRQALRTRCGRQALRAFVVILLWSLAVPLAAQETEHTAATAHYVVSSPVSAGHAEDMGRRLEALLELYNHYFRFDLEDLSPALPVRLFDSREHYAAYLEPLIGEPSNDFVYLHYADARQRELVGYTGDGIPQRALNHHSFVQYLRAFIPEPPLWLREGFAVYFAESRYEADLGRAVYEENLAWLETLKAMVAGTSSRRWIVWEELLFLTPSEVQDAAESFYPQAWGLVSFLVNHERPEISRLLWDSISALQHDSSLEENSAAVYRHAFRWEDPRQLQERFTEYVASRRTFAQWLATGVERYDQDDHAGAERALVEALRLRSDDAVPFYYLGLIHYDRENYEIAGDYYEQALARSDSPAPVLYALGINALARDRREDAREYLESVPEDAPDIRERAEELLRRLSTTGGG